VTAGQQLHIDKTLATLGSPFVYGVPHDSEPDVYGYGTTGIVWELFERVDPTTGESSWAATWWEGRTNRETDSSWTAGRDISPDAFCWSTREEAITWLTAQTLTNGNHPAGEHDSLLGYAMCYNRNHKQLLTNQKEPR